MTVGTSTSGTSTADARPVYRPRGMNPWRLEWLRMTRSPRGIALTLVYLFFGLVGPLMAKYMPELLKYSSSSTPGMKIIMPPPRPADGIINYINQSSQTGMIVLVVVAAGALSFGARRGLATFYRTRVSSSFALIWPRFVANAIVAILAYALGTVAAWYGTRILLGGLPAGRVLLGVLYESIFLIFTVAVVAAAATFGRGTLATVGISIAVLLVILPVAGLFDVIKAWLPTTLMNAPAKLIIDPGLADYVTATIVSLATTVALLGLAVYRARRREL